MHDDFEWDQSEPIAALTASQIDATAMPNTVFGPAYSINYQGTSGPTISTVSGTGGPHTFTTNGTGPATWHVGSVNFNPPPQPSLKVSGTAEFEGDVMIKGHSLARLFRSIEDRLAILQEPTPAKLAKFAALKKAYDHYKTLERLIGDD